MTQLLSKISVCLLVALSFPLMLVVKSLMFPDPESAYWLSSNMGVLTSYIVSLVLLMAITVTLPAIFLERDAKIEALRRIFDRTIDRRGIVWRIHTLKNFITPSFVYIYSATSIAIIASYLVLEPCYVGDGWGCRIIQALRENAAFITTFSLFSTIGLVGMFIGLMVSHSKIKLLDEIKQACIWQANKNDGYIDRELIKLIGEVGYLSYRGKDKNLSIATIQAIVEGTEPLKHETMYSLALAVTEIVENGDKDNYLQALEVMETIIKFGGYETDEWVRDQVSAMILNQFSELLIRVIRLNMGLNLRPYLDDFRVDKVQLEQGFGRLIAERLMRIGITAIEEKEPQIAYSAFDKLHALGIEVVESQTLDMNREVIHQFFGLFAHLWTHDRASQYTVQPFTDSFMKIVSYQGLTNVTLPMFVQDAKKSFMQVARMETVIKLEEVLDVIEKDNTLQPQQTTNPQITIGKGGVYVDGNVTGGIITGDGNIVGDGNKR